MLTPGRAFSVIVQLRRLIVNSSTTGICVTGFTHFGGQCYKVFHEDADKIGHDAAEYQCACRGGYSLAKIETAEENEFVKSLLLGDDAWIGLNDKASQTNYVWADGSSLGSYTNWDTSE